MLNIDEVLSQLEGVYAASGGWLARCPAHDDRKASLKIDEKNDVVLFHCYAGCTQDAVLAALMPELSGYPIGDLIRPDFVEEMKRRAEEKKNQPPEPSVISKKIVKTYDYVDEQGVLLYQVCRYRTLLESGETGKDFRQRQPAIVNENNKNPWIWNLNGVRRVLYRLPELLAADSVEPVFIPEGEKDVETLMAHGFLATTNVSGAVNWQDEYSQVLYARHIIIIEDYDEAGKRRTAKLLESLKPYVSSIRIVRLEHLPFHSDISDYFEGVDGNHPGTRSELLAWLEETPDEFESLIINSSEPEEIIENQVAREVSGSIEESIVEESIVEEFLTEESLFEKLHQKDSVNEDSEFDTELFEREMATAEKMLDTSDFPGLCITAGKIKGCFGTGKVHGYDESGRLGVLYRQVGDCLEFIECDHNGNQEKDDGM